MSHSVRFRKAVSSPRFWPVLVPGLVGLVGSCVGVETTRCRWGALCPAGLACDEVHELCVFPEQLEVCRRADDGTPCTFPQAEGSAFVCRDEVCLEASSCGNGVRNSGEECDGEDIGGWTCWTAAQHLSGAISCNDDCTLNLAGCHTCGDGVLEGPEECDGASLGNARCSDYGHSDGELTCSSECFVDASGCHTCGNGIIEVSEDCDGTNLADASCVTAGFPQGTLGCSSCSFDTSACSSCGDGLLEEEEGEECDDGNIASGDGCTSDCQGEYLCGDLYCEPEAYETCLRCPGDCCPDCGNGRLEPGEDCDDGNNVSGDGCTGDCIDELPGAVCGNGIWEQDEPCDDGNTTPGDGCDAICQLEYVCGDGVCDSANSESCALCPQDCCPDCGDGNLDPGEQCDGNQLGGRTCEDFCYLGGTLSCSTTCQLSMASCIGVPPTCGDNLAGCEEDCDGTDKRSQTCQTMGFSGGTLGCSSSCTFDTSGCTGRLWYLHEGFEGSSLPLGWRAEGLWEVGAPATVGPSAAYEGSQCAGTRISANYTGNATYAGDTLDSPRVDLTSATSPRLRFYKWLDSQASYDGGNLWVSTDGGVSFNLLPGALLDPGYDHDPVQGMPAWTGDFASNGWVPVVANLGSFAGRQIVLRWAFASDGANNDYPGFYVDDVLVVEAAELPVEISTGNPLPPAVTSHAYQMELRATGGSGSYQWSIVGGTNHDWLAIDTATGLLSGTPDASEVGDVTITIRATESTNPSNFDERTFELELISALYYEDLSTQPGDWTFPMGFPPFFPPAWDWGNATSGPMSCHSGQGCVATTVGGNYDASMSMMGATVSTGGIDLSGTVSPTLTFWQWIRFAPADGGYVTITDGNGDHAVTPTPPYNGTTMGNPPLTPGSPGYIGDLSSLGWHLVTIDLSAYAGTTIQINWTIDGTAAGTHPGWYIDDIAIAD